MNNVAAFKIVHKALRALCGSRDCKMDIYCARSMVTNNRRSRIFRPPLGSRPLRGSRRNPVVNSFTMCRTASEHGRRRVRDEALCYVHGAIVWSYLDELIRDDQIRDLDFTGEVNGITVDRCNDYCGHEDSDRCRRVQ